MKFATNLFRVKKAAFQNIYRNAWLGIATIIVLVMALTSVNLLIGVNALLTNAGNILKEKIDVTVFFKRDANEALVTQARFFVADLPQVKSAEVLQAGEALQAFRDRHATDEGILAALDELDGNPLGATMRITARNPKDYPFIMETLKNPQFADAIESKSYDDHASEIQRVQQITDHARALGSALIVIFAIIGILIVYNTIRVAIYTQREEIAIMRLVGASGMYIRAPFVIAGILLALVSAMITAGIVAVGISWVEPALRAVYDGGDPGLSRFFVLQWAELLVYQGGSLAFLVGATSWLAAGRYLKR